MYPRRSREKSRPPADDKGAALRDHERMNLQPAVAQELTELRLGGPDVAAGALLDGRYWLEDAIGSGGTATVYRAVDISLQRRVALKVMHLSVSADAEHLERFRREARAAARLNDPHVVTVIDAGDDEGLPYIVFELVERETLMGRIRRLGRLPIPEATALAIDVGLGLACAHAYRLVHRDVKPSNVLIGPGGEAKLTDFGIARALEDVPLTSTGHLLGTADYMSPEAAMGRPATGQSDIYSLGVCLYEMVVGEAPFRGDNQVAVAIQHLQSPMPDLRRRRPGISDELTAVFERSTAKSPDRRYGTVDEMVRDLEQALAVEADRPAHRAHLSLVKGAEHE